MQHPPLCPKTKLVFKECADSEVIVIIARGDFGLFSGVGESRVLLARYQACAWQDRADSWDAVACRTDNDDYRWRAAADELHRCEDIARAWRKWEREETT